MWIDGSRASPSGSTSPTIKRLSGEMVWPIRLSSSCRRGSAKVLHQHQVRIASIILHVCEPLPVGGNIECCWSVRRLIELGNHGHVLRIETEKLQQPSASGGRIKRRQRERYLAPFRNDLSGYCGCSGTSTGCSSISRCRCSTTAFSCASSPLKVACGRLSTTMSGSTP